MAFVRKHPVLAALLVLIMGFLAYSYTWTQTEHGKLDYRAALSLNMLAFETEHTPDPEIDFTVELPVNLVYALSGLLPKAEVAKTQDITIANDGVEIPARIYWPLAPSSEQPPIWVYFHGGGFVVGSVDIFDPLTRQLATEAGAIVISVDYRLAPRHPWPAATLDGYAAVQWAAANAEELGGDASRIVVGGDSAGGNLAAVVALMARDKGTPKLAAQVLYYPATDLGDNGTSWPSNEKFRDGYGLSTKSMLAFSEAYFGHLDNTAEPYLSPLRAESLEGLPPALVVTAGFDPLTDSAHAYVERMQAAGVDASLAHFPEMIHGFLSIGLFSQQQQAVDRTVDFLQSVVGG